VEKAHILVMGVSKQIRMFSVNPLLLEIIAKYDDDRQCEGRMSVDSLMSISALGGLNQIYNGRFVN
jgi:hypothetical protein